MIRETIIEINKYIPKCYELFANPCIIDNGKTLKKTYSKLYHYRSVEYNIRYDYLNYSKKLKKLFLPNNQSELKELNFNNFPDLEYLCVNGIKKFPDISKLKKLRHIKRNMSGRAYIMSGQWG